MKQQQHQAFLIARVKPRGEGAARYRCLGAYKHTWCYSSAPVKAAHRFITLMKQQSNAQIVREELRSVEGKYGAFGEEEPKVPRLPCSYTMFLLHMAFNVDYDENSPSLSGCWFAAPLGTFHNVLHAAAKVWNRDTMNNEGATIIDITDPTHPRYCFLPGCDTPSGDLVMRPLTARAYLDTLFDPDKPPLFLTAEHCQEVSALLADVPLVGQRAIAEAWPAGPEDCFQYDEDLAKGVEDGAPGDSSASSDGLPSVTAAGVAEAVDPSITQALATNDVMVIAKLISQGDRYQDAMQAIRSIGGPFPGDTIPIIAYILAAAPDTAFDLSDIQLTGEQLLAVLPKDEPLKNVDLSGNVAFTLTGLRAVVDEQRKTKLRIHRLVLIRTGVSDEDLIGMLHHPTLFSHIDEVIHPLFYSWRTGPRYPFSWGVAFNRGLYVPKYDTKEASYVALMSLPQVVQSVRLLVDAVVSKKFPFDVRDVALDALTTTGVIPTGKAWGERSVWCSPVPQDAPMAFPHCWQFAIAQLGGHNKPMEYGFILIEPTKPGFVPFVGQPKDQKVHFMPVDDFLRQMKDEYPPLSLEDSAILRAACEKLDSSGAKQFKRSFIKPNSKRGGWNRRIR